MVHGSDSRESGQREAGLFFPEPLILASASPQRRAILEEAGFAFEVRPANVDEDRGRSAEVALENARRKALAMPGALVLGADTDVALDGDILGKPRDAAHARELGALNGRTHEVVGGSRWRATARSWIRRSRSRG